MNSQADTAGLRRLDDHCGTCPEDRLKRRLKNRLERRAKACGLIARILGGKTEKAGAVAETEVGETVLVDFTATRTDPETGDEVDIPLTVEVWTDTKKRRLRLGDVTIDDPALDAKFGINFKLTAAEKELVFDEALNLFTSI